MRKELSLEEVSKEYPIMLIDTSTLLGILRTKSRATIGEKISNEEEKINSAIFFREFLENGGNFYLTPNILEEYLSRTNYPYKKMIKKNSRNLQKEKLILMRKIKEKTKNIRKLTS